MADQDISGKKSARTIQPGLYRRATKIEWELYSHKKA